jgi:hypothetical protein
MSNLTLFIGHASHFVSTQEEQEQLVAIETEARQELQAAQQVLAKAQEALAVASDKVSTSVTCCHDSVLRHWWQQRHTPLRYLRCRTCQCCLDSLQPGACPRL